MIKFTIVLTDKNDRMQVHVEGDSIQPATEYEVDFAEQLMISIYESGHRIATEHGDTNFQDLIPLQIQKWKKKHGQTKDQNPEKEQGNRT